MHKRLTILFLLALFVPNVWAAECENDEAYFHNVVRDAVSSGQTMRNLGWQLNRTYDFSRQNRPANRLPLLSVSDSLRSSVENYVAQCKFDHSGLPNRGENIFVATGSSWTIQNAVNSWADEARYLSYPAGAETVSCQAGKVCGHYTQMIWQNTTQVGCASKFCPTVTQNGAPMFNGKAAELFICHYSPPGNFVSSSGGPILAPYTGVGVTAPISNPPSTPDCSNSGSAITPILLLLLLND